MKNRKVALALAAVFAVIGLSGCGDDERVPTQDELFTSYNINVNGQSVPCVVYDDGNYGSELTCNWGVYK